MTLESLRLFVATQEQKGGRGVLPKRAGPGLRKHFGFLCDSVHQQKSQDPTILSKNVFWVCPLRVRVGERKISQWNYIKLKSLCTVKKTINKQKAAAY